MNTVSECVLAWSLLGRCLQGGFGGNRLARGLVEVRTGEGVLMCVLVRYGECLLERRVGEDYRQGDREV